MKTNAVARSPSPAKPSHATEKHKGTNITDAVFRKTLQNATSEDGNIARGTRCSQEVVSYSMS
jgi:hypothetical protein